MARFLTRVLPGHCTNCNLEYKFENERFRAITYAIVVLGYQKYDITPFQRLHLFTSSIFSDFL